MALHTPTPSTLVDLDNRFSYHPPKPDQVDRYQKVRELMHTTAAALAFLCPASRELSLALTKLEEANFFANASIARNE